MAKSQIAIIGGGGAGTTAAWLLNQVHDVTIYEANTELGGHVHTHHLTVGGENVHVDVGVDVFHERLSPNLFAIHQLFSIDTFVAPLSFRAVYPGHDNFWSNLHFNGTLRQQLAGEFDRFHLDMAEVLSSGNPYFKKLSLGTFLQERGYSEMFKQQAMLPLMTTFSGCDAPSLEYSLMYIVLAFNMGLLSFFVPGYWRKPKEGFDCYLRRIGQELGKKVRVNTPVKKVLRRNDGRLDVESTGGMETFDKVVFAISAEIALGLIDNPTQQHQKILGGYKYVNTLGVLHSDDSVIAMPDQKEYCEFTMKTQFDPDSNEYGQMTRINNNLSNFAKVSKPLLVTFDPKQKIAADTILTEKRWKLPMLRPTDFYQKTNFHTVQGQGNMWFCGEDTSLTGHEGAVVSGMVIAERLGAKYPFAANNFANVQFNVIKDLMGVRRGRERLESIIGDMVLNFGKHSSLQRSLTHKVIKDIIF